MSNLHKWKKADKKLVKEYISLMPEKRLENKHGDYGRMREIQDEIGIKRC